MTEIDMKAIAYFEQLAKNYEGAISDTRSPTPLFAREIAQYSRAAEQALREKAERDSTVCEFCQEGVSLIDWEDSDVEIHIYEDGQLSSTNDMGEPVSVKVNYCPMCGRRLTQNDGD